jgi:hypothetical protein
MKEKTANVYDGKTDARQGNGSVQPSRFRPTYRALSDEEKALHDEIKTKAVDMERLYQKVCGGRYNSLALTSLEESVMWIVKELTGQGLNPNSEPKNDAKAA